MENIYSVNEQQVVEIDKLYDKIWQFDESIRNLEILLAKNSEEIELIGAIEKELECKEDVIMQEESEAFEKFLDSHDDGRTAL